MVLFRKVAPQHTYCDWLKVVAKTVAKNAHQNQAIIIEIVKDRHLVCSIKSNTWSIVCTTPSLSPHFLLGEGWTSYQIFKEGGLTGPQFLEEGCWERGGDFFSGFREDVGGGGLQFLDKK